MPSIKTAIKENKYYIYIVKISEEIFIASSVLFLALFLISESFPAIKENFINLNYALATVLISGIVFFSLCPQKNKELAPTGQIPLRKLNLKSLASGILISFLGALFIFIKTAPFGKIKFILSTAAFVILCLIWFAGKGRGSKF